MINVLARNRRSGVAWTLAGLGLYIMITTRLITHSLLHSMPYYQLAKAQSYGQESLVTFQASAMPLMGRGSDMTQD